MQVCQPQEQNTLFSTANDALVGTLMTTNNVNDIFPIQQQQQWALFVYDYNNTALQKRQSIIITVIYLSRYTFNIDVYHNIYPIFQ